MRSFDFSPVFRSSVGFDRMARLLDAAHRGAEPTSQPAYPPYNIEKLGDDAYRITMAVAGFGEEDLTITKTDGTLVIAGQVTKKSEEESENDKVRFLHRGIAERAFERRFQLADFIEVKSAGLTNGLLHVELAREVPEEKKPRQIPIGGGTASIGRQAA